MLTRIRWLTRQTADYVRDGVAAASDTWNRFWFQTTDPATLCCIRVLAGLMLLYSHAVWTLDLEAFFGVQSWLSRDVVAQMTRDSYSWSLLSWCRTPTMLWLFHITSLVTFALLTVGLWTRVASVLAFVFTVSYAYRTPGALYGLDQVNGFLSLYLMLAPSGSKYSVDAWLARRRGASTDRPSVSANIAIRLIQCHLCVIYLFAGLSKLQGPTWWNGLAFWGGIANQEYQTLDLTWLANWPLVINAVTHATIVWELTYCVFIWNRWTRPLMLAGAVALHLGIVTALGMPTFGLAMLIANAAFIRPATIRMLIEAVEPTTELKSHASRTEPGRRVDATNSQSPSKPHSRISRDGGIRASH